MLTPQQIQNFIVKAKASGFSDADIQSEIARKQAESAAPAPQEVPQAVQGTPPQPQMPVNPAPQIAPEPSQTGFQNQPADAQMIPQEDGFLKNFIKQAGEAIIAPAKRYGSFVGESIGQAGRSAVQAVTGEREQLMEKVSSGTANPQEEQRLKELTDPIFMDQERFQKLDSPSGIVKDTLQSTAGGASYLIPGGGSVATKIGGAATSGFLASLSESEQESFKGLLSDATKGAAINSLLDGSFRVLGKGLKGSARRLGNKLVSKGEDIQLSNYIKNIGSIPKSLGGSDTLKALKEMGIKATDPDTLLQEVGDITRKNSNIVGIATKAMEESGETIDARPLLKNLEKRIKKEKLASDKTVLQSVYDDLASAIGAEGKDSPFEFYDLKQSMGNKGKWNDLSSTNDKSKAQVWESVYKEANELLDASLKKYGFDDFRSVNKALSVARNASTWAEGAMKKAPSVNAGSLGFADTMLGAGSLAAGANPVTALAAVGARKALKSSAGKNITGGALGLTGKGLQKASNVAGKGKDIVSGGIESLPTAVQELLKTAPDVTKNAIMNAYSSQVATEEVPAKEVKGTTSVKEAEKQLKSLTPSEDATADYDAIIKKTLEEIPESKPAHPVFGAMSKADAVKMAIEMGGSTKQIKEVTDLYDMFKDEAEDKGKQLPAGEVVKLADMKNSANTLDIVETDIQSFSDVLSPIQGRVRALNPYDTRAVDFNARMKVAAQVVGKALEGGKLQLADEIKYQEMLPKISDTPEGAQKKVEAVRALLLDKEKETQEAFTRAGYAVN